MSRSVILTPDPITITNQLTEEEDAPAPTPAQVLVDHFRQRTAIEPNSRNGTYDRDWRAPLDKLLELSGGDLPAALDLMNRAIAVAQGDNEQRKVYTVASPRSIVGMAANIAATQRVDSNAADEDTIWRRALAAIGAGKIEDERLRAAIRAVGTQTIQYANGNNTAAIKRSLGLAYRQAAA